MKQMTKMTIFEDGGTIDESPKLPRNTSTMLDLGGDQELQRLDFKPGTLGICVAELPPLPEGLEYCTKEDARVFCVWDSHSEMLYWAAAPKNRPVFGYAKKKKPAFDPKRGSIWQHRRTGLNYLLTGDCGTGYCLVDASGRWFLQKVAPTRAEAFGGHEDKFNEFYSFNNFAGV